MPTSSARPERLHQFAASLAERTIRVRSDVAEVAEALRRYQIACAEAPAVGRPDAAAAGRLDQALALADAVSRIARTFAAADSGGAPSLATANDVALSRRLATDHPGVATTALLQPQHHDEGRQHANQLATSDAPAAAKVLSRLSTQTMTSAYATGLLDGLGSPGVQLLIRRIEASYERSEIGHQELEAAMAGLAEVLRCAGTGLPTLVSSPVPQQAGPGPAITAPYALDLSIITAMGASSRGQEALRQLTLGAQGLHPAVVAALAEAILRPVREPDGRWTLPSRALVDRTRRRGLPELFDLPILRLLQADTHAAGLWELASPRGSSRLAPNFTRRTRIELEVVADITRTLYIEPVTRMGQPAWTPSVAAAPETAGQRRTDRALIAILSAVQGLERSPSQTAAVLADLVQTHPDFFVDVLGDNGWQTLEPAATVTGYFAVVAQDPAARQRTAESIIGLSATVAEQCLADADPASVRADHLRTCLQPARHLGLALEEGAFQAGQHLDVVVAFGIATAARAAKVGVGAVARATGPPGALIGYLGRGLVEEGRRTATGRYAESNDRLDRQPAQAIDRSLPHVAALAMVADDRWRAQLNDPDRIRPLDVVGSTEDWATFRIWIDDQPPAARATLRELLSPQG